MATQITKNFTLEEFFANSATAKAKKIDNTPNEEQKANIIRLVKEVLQPIRDVYGKPIIVSAGYRCPKLNTAVGGVKNSQHLYGMAADIVSKGDTEKGNKELWDVIMKLAKENKIDCRQIIWEYGHKNIGPSWIHLATNGKPYDYRKNQLVYIGV